MDKNNYTPDWQDVREYVVILGNMWDYNEAITFLTDTANEDINLKPHGIYVPYKDTNVTIS